MVQRIPLTNGSDFARVDDVDYAFLMQWRWRRNNKGYAVRDEIINGKRVTFNMHRIILNAQRGQYVDHIDNDTLNNCRANLRLCTQSQNQANRRKHRNNTSGYKGVTRRGDRWHARIEVRGRVIHLGYHDSAERASRVYDHAAMRFFGAYARTNHPNGEHIEYYERLLDQILAHQQPKLPFVRKPAPPPVPRRKSAHRGVYWERGRWRATIYRNGHRYHLGYFTNEGAAAQAYQQARSRFAVSG